MAPRNRRRRSSVSPPRQQQQQHQQEADHSRRSHRGRRSTSVSVRSFHRNPGLVTPPTNHPSFRLSQSSDNRTSNHGSASNHVNSLAFLAPPLHQEDHRSSDAAAAHSRSAMTSASSSTSRRTGRNNHSGNRSPTKSPTKSPSAHLRKKLSELRQGSLSKIFGNNHITASNPKNTTNACNPDSHTTSDTAHQQQQDAQLTASKIHAHKIRKHHLRQMTARLQQHHRQRYGSAVQQDVLSILEFWRTTCPSEVTLKILAFCGPSMMAQLQQTQRQIYQLLQYDISWRVLCEELYKYPTTATATTTTNQNGPTTLPIDTTWKEHYRRNPVVPVDFSSVGQALAVVGAGWTTKEYKKYTKLQQQQQQNSSLSALSPPEIQHPVTVWLRLDHHSNTSSITSERQSTSSKKKKAQPQPSPNSRITTTSTYEQNITIPISTLRRTTQVTIRTMYTTQEQRKLLESKVSAPNHNDSLSSFGQQSAPEECHPDSQTYNTDNPLNARALDGNLESESDGFDRSEQNDSTKSQPDEPRPIRAMLKSRPHSRRRNEPLILVLRGQLVLQDVELEHATAGVDIWSGNAAVHIQPSSVTSVLWLSSASALVKNSSIRSSTGRGIVTVEGGQVVCQGSYIHHCAATGVYVGGRGSTATLRETDVWYNGVGNLQTAGGIARGHSGIYVEQNKSLELIRSSVAYNTACGISLIGSPVQPALELTSEAEEESLSNPPSRQSTNTHPRSTFITLGMQQTHILSNGCSPIDMPQGILAAPEPDTHAHLVQVEMDLEALQQNPYSVWLHAGQENRIGVVGVPQAASAPLQEELERRRRAAMLRQKAAKAKEGRELVQERQQQPSILDADLDWNSSPPWNEE